MDRLFLAAQTGNIEDLQQLLQENPFILHTVSLQSVQNPLHLACLFGHLEFAKELLRLKPEFAKELNPDGFSPLHLATANGHEKIAREIIRLDPELCGLTGREKKTAFHIAAVKGKAEIVSEMLAACGECIEDVTVQKESALHLAVKNSQFESLKVMLDWVRLKKKDEVFSMKDEQGNRILHLAVWKKQMQVLQLLLDYATTSSDINAMNQSGLTLLDLLLIFPSEAGDRELLELLHSAGAVRARDISVLISEPHQNREVIGTSTNLLDYFKFHKERDSPSDVRTILLVIAVLVATATYQVGINPPGGSWQDDSPTGMELLCFVKLGI